MASEKKSYSKEQFGELVANHHQMVYHVCYSFLHNKQDAEDITQEVFIKGYQDHHKLKDKSKFKSWIYRIAVTRSLNEIRNNKSKYHKEITELNIAESFNNPSVELENTDLQKILMSAISKLPKKQAKAFILNKYEGLSATEVAEIMKCSVSSAEVNIHRARKTLQKQLFQLYKKNDL